MGVCRILLLPLPCNILVCVLLQVEEFSAALEEVLIKKEDGMKYMPELYAVPADKVNCFVC